MPNVIIAAIMAACLACLFLYEKGSSDQLDHFVNQCVAKGGTALSGYNLKAGKANGWIGCFKGVTEIPNEE